MLLKVAMEEQTERHGKLGWDWQKYNYNVEELDQGAVTLEVDLVCRGLGDALRLSRSAVCESLCGYVLHQRRVLFEGCEADPPQDYHCEPFQARHGPYRFVSCDDARCNF